MRETAARIANSPGWTIGILIVAALWSAFCLWRLWKRPASLIARILWSVVLLMPLLGPLFYLFIFTSPSSLPEGERAPQNDSAFYGGSGR